MSDDDLIADLRRWFDGGDDLAHRRAFTSLRADLHATREVLDVLGSGAVEDLRQDVLGRLLDREAGRLRDRDTPRAYARKAWRNELTSALRKWGPRLSRDAEVREHILQAAPTSHGEEIAVRLDAERAVRIAEQLDGKGRLAILLTTRPDRIPDADWDELAAHLPPPPPPRPTVPLDREEASLLLYPPAAGETTTERYQRLNSFDKAFKRAIAVVREALGVQH